MQARSVSLRLALVWALWLLAACQQKVATLDPASADAWSRVIVAHTSGVVSRKAEIRVLFSGDVTAAKALTAATLSLEPAVAGEISLRGPRELVLVPKTALQPGQEYHVKLSADALGGIPRGIKPYEFSFHVQTPQYDLALADLESDTANDRRMIQRGKLVTADAEDGAAIERMLSAVYRSNKLPAVWSHSGDGREHGFTLSGIERQPQAEVLRVALDGRPIGAGKGEDREVSVPAVGEFGVVNARALEEEGRKEIQIAFSDRLDEQQDLKGMVQLSTGEFTTRIEGNRLTVYPAEDLSGDVTVTLAAGIRNARGERLAGQSTHTLTLTSEKPQVRFVGNGVILPDAKLQTIAFEAVSARSVQVTATRVYAENIPQFLQVNQLNGSNEMGRVGRYLWRKTLPLNGPKTGRWQRYEIDVTELMQKQPGALIQLSLQLRPADSAYGCPGAREVPKTATAEARLVDQEDGESSMQTAWEYSEEYFGVAEEDGEEYDYSARWRDRKDPCKSSYYVYGYNEGVVAQRNLIASNIGLLAKADARGRLLVSVTNLATAGMESGVSLQLRNFQNQLVGSGKSDGSGMATLEPSGIPFLLIAESGGRRAYLKLNNASALPVSHFDAGGESIRKGLKGAIYGERGVWRPGDALGLTFVIHDRERTLPANHPATLELLDPRGRSTQTIVNARPVDGFYRFDVRTAADAPTGNWTAKVSLGGVTFTRALKIETVMPNRLKVELDTGQGLLGGGKAIKGAVQSAWLSGASAGGLKADINLRLTATQTTFAAFKGYVFDDPARMFKAEPQEIFAGELNSTGSAQFEKQLELGETAPGMLSASFTTRVFERGGAFSTNTAARSYAPYDRFVGLKLPGDGGRTTLQVDQEQTVELATVTAQGAAAPSRKVSVKLYKVEWRWWWDRGEDSLAAYIARENSTRVMEADVTTNAQGRAQWKFKLGEEQWGRYLLRVCDAGGGHCAGSVFYVDWPYWRGEGREQEGPAATMLNLTADKANYQVGDTATIQLPESAQGRALVTVENGSAVLDARWVTPTAQNARITIPVTAAMSPNAYVAVTLIQPHAGKKNDRPIRLYGVIPLLVVDPDTNLKPVLQAANEWRPEA
ncbi:MAG: MG2 domain-containing protein, partial [Steroidobacteraceae bacterium]